MIKVHNILKKKIFLIILPPPNITGFLHIGHFFQYFILDVIIKWNLLQENKVLFFFGFDHAGISTINKFKNVKNIIIQKKKIIKNFFKQIKYINFFIINKKIIFTLNKNYNSFIIKKFLILFNKKKIFLNNKILNFNKNIGIVSDNEIKKTIFKKYLYYIKYKTKKYIYIISTSNINLIINKSILVTNFKINFKKIKSPLKIFLSIYNIKKNIINFSKIIKLSFKNNNDYLFFKKININIFNIKKKFFFLNFIIKNNYLLCIKKYNSYNYIYKKFIVKNKKIKQWFFKIKKIINFNKILIKIIFFPVKYKKIFFSWINNISNWCISRKIIWGTQFPMVIDNEFNIYSIFFLRFIKYYKIKEVFDTWFNSSFWVMFIYIKFKKTNNLILSGFDIIFYWLIKIIINNIFFTKKTLIKSFLIHGLIKDKNNKKISKTTNNIINFIHIKKNINKIKNILIKNIFNNNKLYINIYFKKTKKILKKINKININDLFSYYNFKKQYIFNINKYIFNFNFNNLFIFKNNIFSKKIYLFLIKLLFNKKILKNNWNFTNNFFINKYNINYFYIIKIKNKLLIINDLIFLYYFEIFFLIKTIFYVKYKN
ncbi:MAG: class I tRNA ligase family protein [Candidatus Carsonella ruddii]